MRSVFIAHAAADRTFALGLAAFLELGCEVRCTLAEPAAHVADQVEEGAWADHVVLVASKHAWPAPIARERWDPLFADLPLACILLDDCAYPLVLRRQNCFDHRVANARRAVKRWIWRSARGESGGFANTVTASLEGCYQQVADQPGTAVAAPTDAERFAEEAADEFAGVFWLACQARSLAQVAGELGAQIQMTLNGEAEANLERIRAMLAGHRCLVVLDGASEVLWRSMRMNAAVGRTSILRTDKPLRTVETPRTLGYARWLIQHERNAEAYELLSDLLDEDATGAVARELAWVCDHLGRHAEGMRLRGLHPEAPTHQMNLF